MPKHTLKALLLLALTFVAVLVGCGTDEMVVALTRDDLQTRIAPRFPFSKNWLIIGVVLSEPEVFLPEGANQIGLNAQVEVNIPMLKTISGHIGVTATPRYDTESKSFYLDHASVERLDLPGLKPELTTKAKEIIETMAQQELGKHPIYELTGRNLKEITASYTLREVRVRDGKLQATFSLPL